MRVRHGDSSLASSFIICGLILSGPEALCGFKFCRSFSTPGSVMSNSPMSGYCGWGFGRGLSSSLVKTDLNWSFRISAFFMPLE